MSAIQKVKGATAAESDTAAPRGLKDFTRVKETAAEVEVISTKVVEARSRHVNKMFIMNRESEI